MTPVPQSQTTVRAPAAHESPFRSLLAPGTSNIWAVLGGVRFYLAVCVMIYHADLAVLPPSLPFWWLARNGYGAVLGFFLISGYSIAASVARETHGYYERRFQRIYPVYFASWLFSLLPWLLYGMQVQVSNGTTYNAPTAWQLFGNLFLLQGFLTTTSWSLGPAWSLSIECFYYLFAPWLKRQSSRILIALIGLSGLAYIALSRMGHTPSDGETYGIAALMLAWAWLLGFLYRRDPRSELSKALVIFLPPALLCFYCTWRLFSIDTAATYFVAAIALLYGGELKINAAAARVLSWLGDVSYPLYVTHFCVLMLCSLRGIENAWLIWLSSLIVAVIILYAVDYPARAYFKRRSRRSPPVAMTALPDQQAQTASDRTAELADVSTPP